jgi:hypothetical protein
MQAASRQNHSGLVLVATNVYQAPSSSAKLSSFEQHLARAEVSAAVVRQLLAIVLVLGISLMIAAPLLRRYRLASPALAGGASMVLAFAIVGLAHSDPRIGQAAIEANRRRFLFVLACELPALVLALISLRYFTSAFWLGWAINLAFALYLTVVAVWLEFFWHW